MSQLLIKALLSGVLVAAASEAAKRSTLLGALIISLPLTSLLAAVWLWRDTQDAAQVAAFSWSVLAIIPPSLLFFVVLPLTLRPLGFWGALGVAVAATALAYAGWVALLRALG